MEKSKKQEKNLRLGTKLIERVGFELGYHKGQKELLEELFHNYSLDSKDDFLNEIRKKINKLSTK